jgi:hypothetical protein
MVSVMISGFAQDVGTVVGALLGLCALAGLVVRWILLPYLREQVVKPLKETHRQVTPHDRPVDAEPTIVDRLEDLAHNVTELQGQADELGKKARTNRQLAVAAGQAADAVRRELTNHEAWAREEDSRLWSAIRTHERLAGHDEVLSRIDRLLDEGKQDG